jgi:hypothetical protein
VINDYIDLLTTSYYTITTVKILACRYYCIQLEYTQANIFDCDSDDVNKILVYSN